MLLDAVSPSRSTGLGYGWCVVALSMIACSQQLIVVRYDVVRVWVNRFVCVRRIARRGRNKPPPCRSTNKNSGCCLQGTSATGCGSLKRFGQDCRSIWKEKQTTVHGDIAAARVLKCVRRSRVTFIYLVTIHAAPTCEELSPYLFIFLMTKHDNHLSVYSLRAALLLLC